MRTITGVKLVGLLGGVLFVSVAAVADPVSQTLGPAATELERARLQNDPSDRPDIIGAEHGYSPSAAADAEKVSVDCGRSPPRTVNGRLHVRCSIATTRIERRQKDLVSAELEIGDLPAHGAQAFAEACVYLAGRPMRPQSDPATYCLGESRCWSGSLSARLDTARTQQTEGQKAFLAGVVQACGAKDKEQFVQAYVTYLRQVEEHTCRLSVSSQTADFEKVDANTWVASPSPSVCGETVFWTLWRIPGGGLMWNYKSVDTYPASLTGLCAQFAGKTEVHEYVVTNQRVRDLGCRYFDI
jgi:hypothetical protein